VARVRPERDRHRRAATQVERACAYGFVPRGSGLAIDFFRADRYVGSYFRDLDEVVRDMSVGWACYDPVRPEPSQRNAVVVLKPEQATAAAARLPAFRPLLERHTIMQREQQLRVLACDGPALLA
jgi:hypothetical protein